VFKHGKEENPEVDLNQSKVALHSLEGKLRAKEEEKFKKIDEKRLKKLKEKDLPLAISKQQEINKKVNDHENTFELPAPQL